MNNQITVVKEFTFDAAHYLPGYDGACANLHGHTYRLQVGVKYSIDPQTGMVMDFGILKSVIQPIIDRLDHACLNDIGDNGFPCTLPTAENMVLWMAEQLLQVISVLEFIRLYETPTSYAEWRNE